MRRDSGSLPYYSMAAVCSAGDSPAVQDMWAAFKSVGMAPLAAAAAAAASERLAGDACEDPQERITSSSSSNGSSVGQQVTWGCLLRLQQPAACGAAAVAAYEANQPKWEEVEVGVLPRTAAAAEQHSQQ
jgi:hypothetical protein